MIESRGSDVVSPVAILASEIDDAFMNDDVIQVVWELAEHSPLSVLDVKLKQHSLMVAVTYLEIGILVRAEQRRVLIFLLVILTVWSRAE